MELTVEQIFLVGLVASGISAVIRLLSAKFGVELSKAVMTVIVSVVAFILAVLFNLPALPIYVEPIQFVLEWVTLISAYLGMATLIYNLILDKVLDKVNLTTERFLPG